MWQLVGNNFLALSPLEKKLPISITSHEVVISRIFCASYLIASYQMICTYQKLIINTTQVKRSMLDAISISSYFHQRVRLGRHIRIFSFAIQ